jgi:arginine/lysine/ornithine decarboxylase
MSKEESFFHLSNVLSMDKLFSQSTAPFFEEICRYAGEPLIAFHTPGHKSGLNWEQDWLGSRLAHLDLTEIPALDWQGALTQAEKLAAEFYGADQSFFLVQGASQGILALLIGAFHPGDPILVSRNCHISVIHAIILADLVPIYIETPVLEEWGVPGIVPESTLIQSLALYPDCKGVVITNPTYQGVLGNLSGLRKIIGERILIIDEAHGGYFGWSGLEGFDAYPYADAWVQGTHKMLGSMTQTGILHLRNGRIDGSRIKHSLELITTTSPSYILLASLDWNRRFLATTGKAMFKAKTPAILEYKKEIAGIGALQVLDGDRLLSLKGKVDPWRLCLSFKKLGFSGYRVEQILRLEFKIQAEYADFNQVTLLMAPWQHQQDLEALKNALKAICRRLGDEEVRTILPGNIPPLKLHPREAALGAGCFINLSEAVGRVSADLIAPYPPGIPLIAPGELIREQEIALIERILQSGGIVRGVSPKGEIRVANCG